MLFHQLSDNFNDNSLDSSKWYRFISPGATVVETSSRLRLSTASGSSSADIFNNNNNIYDLTSSYILFEIFSLSSQHPNFSFQVLTYKQDFSNGIYFIIENSLLKALYFDSMASPYYTALTATYNSSIHKWLRIRESGGTIYWDYSTNGANWTNFTSIASFYDLSQSFVTVGVSTSSDLGVKTAIIDNFNLGNYRSSLSGTLTLSGTVSRPSWNVNSSLSGTLNFSGSVLGIIPTDTSRIEKKTFMYKVYDEDNNFLGVWDDVISEPNWSHELNTIGAAQTILLARNSDSISVETEALLDNTGASIKDNNNFDILTSMESRNKVGPGSTVNHNYRVDIYIFYGETTTIDDNLGFPIEDNEGNYINGTIGAPNGIRRFSGFISEININYGDTENTEVQLMSYGYDLDQYPVVNDLGETTVAFNSTDPGTTVREGLDQFTEDGIDTFTTYTAATVELTGTTPSYTFRNNTYKELLETAVKLAPEGWFFYVGLGDNLVRFKPKPTTPTHTFYLGKHIKNLNLRSYIGDVVNDVLFTGGGDPALYKRYTETPVAGTRRGLSRLSDSRVTLEASADILSEGEIDEKKNIQYRSAIEILDKTYDIESIELGDLVAFRNFDNDVDLITMQIVALNYTPDVISLALDTLPPTVPKRLSELRKALDAQENQYVPDIPDV